jgi:hypothetical protein
MSELSSPVAARAPDPPHVSRKRDLARRIAAASRKFTALNEEQREALQQAFSFRELLTTAVE